MTEILKVSTKSNPNLVAGALVNILKEKENVEIHSIGAGALNQAIKSVAIARGFVAPSGVNPELTSIWWGLLGSCLATLAVVVPSFILVLYSSHFIRRHSESGTIKAIFGGLRPVVVGLIASAAIMLMNKANFNPNGEVRELIINIIICIGSFCLVYFSIPFKGRKIKIHPILVIIIAGIVGYLIYGI